ncbi:MFS transporter [Levilactobacillus brevis]|uniref:MFS transporter n=1 Tax=Levilactobacillus brevis TaxID=1580 RepID=UPI001D000657|nr:MFS transporter [Levilactobacillus brevis]MCB5232511.1 MFS transporter [Levilactobacillus brevis]
MSKKLTPLILLLAMNLRLAVTAIPPLFGIIQQHLHITNTTTALLVTLPLICFAIGALAAPRLIHQLGIGPLLLLTTGILVIANIGRPINRLTLIGGTILIGGAIALLNILIPTLIAATTPSRVTQMTSYYSLTMNLIAAIGTAIILPLATVWGWTTAMQLLGLPAGFALLASVFYRHTLPTRWRVTSTTNVHWKLDRSTTLLALFMGCQSLIFYTLTTWLPTIYQAFGASAAEAGTLLSVFQLVGIPAALVLTYRWHFQRLLPLILLGYLVGLTCLLWRGWGHWLSAIILGFTCSLVFTLALNLIATSSRQVTVVAQRSAIAQSCGYLLAAVGPLLLGQLNHIFASWQPGLLLIGGLMILTVSIGYALVTTTHQQ